MIYYAANKKPFRFLFQNWFEEQAKVPYPSKREELLRYFDNPIILVWLVKNKVDHDTIREMFG